ncbi:GMC oxidoreductase [Micromonospora chersina]|uniref:GMC oxidoreductase n=1 Tax=Micromonospora chersina TaxID=47854 RepID=UPI003CA8C925
MPEAPHRIAVVGGGLAGLEAAVAAAGSGAVVEVFEAGPRNRTRHVDWDTGTHAGDEKVQPWTSDGWGAGGGLSERLGGRSLCWHGVLLGLEPAALADWDPEWSGRLAGADGCYAAVLSDLLPDFPELAATGSHPGLAACGLRPVPQAARLDAHGRFEAYSPLARALELGADGRIRFTRGRVRAVTPEGGGVAVDIGTQRRRGFDSCVLASSAIGNARLLATSLDRDLATTVTDHFCVGGFVRLPPGPPIAPFRHRMLWSGFTEVPEIGTNVFVLERPPLPGGDRLVQIQAVIEQPAPYSELTVEASGRTHVRARVSDADRALLKAARVEVRRRAERLAGGPVTDLAPDTSSDTPWSGHDDALAAVAGAAALAYCRYDVPYGSFEHEACTHPIGGGPVEVSRGLEVVELPGVYVAGPGTFPRLGAANPALTIIAMSRWLGERLS